VVSLGSASATASLGPASAMASFEPHRTGLR
jgi:hypothetical protein